MRGCKAGVWRQYALLLDKAFHRTLSGRGRRNRGRALLAGDKKRTRYAAACCVRGGSRSCAIPRAAAGQPLRSQDCPLKLLRLWRQQRHDHTWLVPSIAVRTLSLLLSLLFSFLSPVSYISFAQDTFFMVCTNPLILRGETHKKIFIPTEIFGQLFKLFMVRQNTSWKTTT